MVSSAPHPHSIYRPGVIDSLRGLRATTVVVLQVPPERGLSQEDIKREIETKLGAIGISTAFGESNEWQYPGMLTMTIATAPARSPGRYEFLITLELLQPVMPQRAPGLGFLNQTWGLDVEMRYYQTRTPAQIRHTITWVIDQFLHDWQQANRPPNAR